MASCQLFVNLDPNQGSVIEHETNCTNNDFLQLPSVTVRDPRNLSTSSSGEGSSIGSTSSSSSSSPVSSAASSPGSSPTSCGGIMQVISGNLKTDSGVDLRLDMDKLETDVGQLRGKFEDLSSNNNNLHFSSPTKDKLRYNRRSLIRSNSSACSSISEDMEYESDDNESESASSSPRHRPPLQRSSAIHEDGDSLQQLSPRSISPISSIEELETYSGIKTVVRRPRKSQNGRTSPSWRWSVMGVAASDYDAVTRATHKGQHHHHHHLSFTSSPAAALNTPSGGSNGHASLSRRSSLVSTPSALVSPRTKRLSTEFRRLSLQMDMPWRDPNERLVKFADWLNKRTEALMERSARARQKTYELLRLAKQRQQDRIEF